MSGSDQGLSAPSSSPLNVVSSEATGQFSGNERPNDGTNSNSGGLPAQSIAEGKYDEPEEYRGPTRDEFKKIVEDRISSMMGGRFSSEKYKKKSTWKGIALDNYPAFDLKLDESNWTKWKVRLEDYTHEHLWCRQVVFEDWMSSHTKMINRYDDDYTKVAIEEAHEHIHTSMYNLILKAIPEVAADEIKNTLRLEHQANHVISGIPIRYNANKLYLAVKDKFDITNKETEVITVMKSLYGEESRYNISMNPQTWGSRMLELFGRQEEICGEAMPKKIIASFLLYFIPPYLVSEVYLRASVLIGIGNGVNQGRSMVFKPEIILKALKEVWEAKNKGKKPQKDNEAKGQGDKRKHQETINAVQNKKNAKKKVESKALCWLCGIKGHTKWRCPNKEELKKQGVDINSDPHRPKKAENSIADKDQIGPATPTGAIIEMACQFGDPAWKNPKELNADSAASMHLVSDRTILRNITKLEKPIMLGGAFGRKTWKITEIGDLPISGNRVLKNVGICPHTQLSLISEHRLLNADKLVLVKNDKTAELFHEDDIEFVIRNPPRIVFTKKGSFWSYTLGNPMVSQFDQLKEKDIIIPRPGRRRASMESSSSSSAVAGSGAGSVSGNGAGTGGGQA